MSLRFDAVVVGAGPAGAAAAYAAAKGGLKVLLLERGRGAGSKQVYGGRVYSYLLGKIYDGLEKKAPVERWVRKERISVLDGKGRTTTIEYEGMGEARSFTAYLTKLTSWMVDEAVKAGAIFVDEVRVDSIVRDSAGKVVGVEANGERAEAGVVIDAEGTNRLLLEGLGLAERTRPTQVALGAKEVIKLGEKEVNERFGLEGSEGLSWILAGDATEGIPGGAFIYTNKETVSLGLVIYLDAAIRMAREPVHDMVEGLRNHAALRKYFEGGDILEYSAKVTPESGYRYMPRKLVADGLMVAGDAAGMLLSTGYTFRGVDYAAYSGYMAGQAAIKALEAGGARERTLAELYEEPLRRSQAFRDLRRHRGVEDVMSNADFFKKYPELAGGVMSAVFDLEEGTPTIWEAATGAMSATGISAPRLLLDALRMVRKL